MKDPTARRSRGSGRPSSPMPATPDTAQLLELIGRLRVRELARIADLSIERLVAEVLRAEGLPALRSLDREPPKVYSGPPSTLVPIPGAVPPGEPALVELAGRATLREIEAIVDRWLLGFVLQANDWNVSRSARRLGVSRRFLRERWAAVLQLAIEPAGAGLEGSVEGVASGPAPPSLAGILAGGGTYREVRRAVRGWLVGWALELEGGNVTRAAKVLGWVRRDVRKIRGVLAGGGAGDESAQGTDSTVVRCQGGQAIILARDEQALRVELPGGRREH